MPYQLIALDLDGTLLNSRKQLPGDVAAAIRSACAAGKTVVFDTGRAVPELAELIALLPEVRYAVFASGGGLYDIHERRAFGLQPVPEEPSHSSRGQPISCNWRISQTRRITMRKRTAFHPSSLTT